MALMSLRGYSKHRGCALRAVQKAIESGRIRTTTDDKGRVKIESDEADRRWAELTDPAKQRGTSAGIPGPLPAVTAPSGEDPGSLDADDDIGPEDYFKAKALREKYMAELARLNFREKAGELVEAKVIQEEWQKIVTATKTKLLSVPSKLRARVPHLTTADIATVEEEIRAALVELAQGASQS